MRRRGGPWDYGFRSRIDYEALKRERIPEKHDVTFYPDVFYNPFGFGLTALVGGSFLQTVVPALFGDGDGYGATVLRYTLAPALFAPGPSFGTTTVALPGAQFLTPAIFGDGDGYGTSILIRQQFLAPALFGDGDGYGTTVLSGIAPAQTISPALFADGDGYGATALLPAQALTPAGFSNNISYGTTVVAPASSTQSVTPALYTTLNGFGTANVSGGASAAWYDADSQYSLMSAGADLNGDRYFLPALGAEKLTNGDFSSGMTGWNPGTLSAESGGIVTITGDGTGFPQVYKTGTNLPVLVPGRLYRLSARGNRGTANGNFQVSLNTPSVTLSFTTASAWQTLETYFVATAPSVTSLIVMISNAAATGAAQIDYVSIQEVLLDRTGGTSERGPELLDNGDMSAALQASDYSAGWVADIPGGTSTVTIAGGVLSLTSDGVNHPSADQSFVTEIGATYDLVIGTATSNWYVGTARGGAQIFNGTTYGASRPIVLRFTATTTTTWLRFATSGTTAQTYDNVSVTKTPIGGKFPKRAATFDEWFAYTASSNLARTYTDAGGVVRDMSYVNSLAMTDNIGASPWGGAGGITFGNPIPAPLGGGLAYKVVPGTTAAYQYIAQIVNVYAGRAYTFSAYFKAAGWRYITLGGYGQSVGGLDYRVTFDLNDPGFASTFQTSGMTYAIGPADGNGWRRLSVTWTSPATGTMRVDIIPNGGSGNHVQATGDGTSGFHIWGMQYEAGSVATAYQANTTTGQNGTNQPRFTYVNGKRQLRLEDQRTNLLFPSQDISGTGWGQSAATRAVNVVTAPDGTLTADKVQEDATTALHSVTSPTVTATAAAHTISVYLKAAERSWALVYSLLQSNVGVWFDLTNGVVGTKQANVTAATITSAGSGWYRCTITFTANATTSNGMIICPATGDGSLSTAGVVGNGIYVWGAQIELGAFASDYIPTTTVALARAIEGARVSPLIEAITGRGVFTVVERSEGQNNTASPAGANARIIGGANSQRFLGTTSIAAYGLASVGIGSALTVPLPAHGGAAWYDQVSGQRGSYNGSAVTTSSTVIALANFSQIWLGRDSTGTAAADAPGYYDFVGFSPERVSDAQLQAWAVPAPTVSVSASTILPLTPPTGYNFGGVTFTADQVAGPDGTLTADLMVETAGSSQHYMQHVRSVTLGTVLQNKVRVKAAPTSARYVNLSYHGNFGAERFWATIDLQTGALVRALASGTGATPTANVAALTNGWYELTMTCTTTQATNAQGEFMVNLNTPNDAGFGPFYNGDGVSGAYIWGHEAVVL